MGPFELAQRYLGVHEIAGKDDHPLIRWWLSLCFDGKLDVPDETPWCSAFVNGVAWELRLPRSKSARARSWLTVGLPVSLTDARPDDVVVFNRGGSKDPNVIQSPGHVAFFAGLEGDRVLVVGGNQSDGVTMGRFKQFDVLGARRIVG